MASSAYETTAPLWATSIASEAEATGAVQAASCSVIGSDATVTPLLAGAKIGEANIADALEQWDGDIP